MSTVACRPFTLTPTVAAVPARAGFPRTSGKPASRSGSSGARLPGRRPIITPRRLGRRLTWPRTRPSRLTSVHPRLGLPLLTGARTPCPRRAPSSAPSGWPPGQAGCSEGRAPVWLDWRRPAAGTAWSRRSRAAKATGGRCFRAPLFKQAPAAGVPVGAADQGRGYPCGSGRRDQERPRRPEHHVARDVRDG